MVERFHLEPDAKSIPDCRTSHKYFLIAPISMMAV